MSVFGRYLIYLVDCLAMLFVIGMQFFIFRGELPFGYDTDRWLPLLLGSDSVRLVTLLGGTAFWFIVDYHENLTDLRRSTVISTETGTNPDFCTRFLRSFLKALSIFTFPPLLLFAVFSDGHRFLHDYVAKTRRVKLPAAG